MGKINNRISHYDGLKLIAMMIVFTTHYMADFQYDIFDRLPKVVKFITVEGISGKMGVAIFGVILGYFASLSHKSTLNYTVNRYFYFFLSGLLINTVIFLLPYGYRSIFVDGDIRVLDVIRNSVLIDDGIYPTFWCMIDFFLASVICYLNGKYEVCTIDAIIEMLILLYFNQLWICICMMGYIFKQISEKENIKRFFEGKISLIVLILSFFLCKQEENEIVYFLDGVFAVVLLLYVDNHKNVRKIVGSKMIALLGQKSMGMYLCHVICYMVVGNCFAKIGGGSAHYGFWICLGWVCSLGLVCVLGYFVDNVLKRATMTRIMH